MNLGTNTTVKSPSMSKLNQVIFIAKMTSLGLLGAIIILGNLASIITFVKTQSLRRRSHYLIICLSAADLLVGVVASLLLYHFLTGPKLNAYAYALEFFDTLTGVASLLILSVISVERFSAILFPFHHRMLRFRVYVALSSFPWILATVIAVMSIIGHFKRSVYYTYLHISFVIVALALLTIAVSYISMGCKMRRQSNVRAENQNRALRDKKLVITLLIVTLSSLLTWMPLQGYVVVKNFCKECPLPDFNDIFIMKFLQFCNSGLNVFIYMVRMPEFRVAFLAIFCRRKRRTMKRSNDTMQKTNQAFTTDENTRVTRSTIVQTTEFDDFIQGKEQNTFHQETNVIDKQINNTIYNNKITVFSQANNRPKKFNGERGNTFGKPSEKNTETLSNQGHIEATQGSNERKILPYYPENGFSSSKYEIALDKHEDYDTPM